MSHDKIAMAFVLEGLDLPSSTSFHINMRASNTLALRSVAKLVAAKECVILILSKSLRNSLFVVHCVCVTYLELHLAGVGVVNNSEQNMGAKL